jgi:hypothetical protein
MAVYCTYEESGKWYWAVRSSQDRFRSEGGPCTDKKEAEGAASGFAQARGEPITGEYTREEMLEL